MICGSMPSRASARNTPICAQPGRSRCRGRCRCGGRFMGPGGRLAYPGRSESARLPGQCCRTSSRVSDWGGSRLGQRLGVQVVDVAVGDADAGELAGLEVLAGRDDDEAVDLGASPGERARRPLRRPRRPARSSRGR